MRFAMRLRCLLNTSLLVLGLFFAVSAVSPGPLSADGGSMVEVGVTLQESFLRLAIPSGYSLTEQSSGALINIPAGEYRFLLSGNNINIEDRAGKSLGVFRSPLYLRAPASAENSTFEIRNAVQGNHYRGDLRIARDVVVSRIAAINVIDLETYLRGAVPREMPANWGNSGGMEALKSQAVAARTYALYQMKVGKHSGYHLCDSTHCQNYGGRKSEASFSDQAISATRGEILTFKGAVIEPLYHATNGGYTELSQNVWNNSFSYFKSEPDPYDNPANPLGLKDMMQHSAATWEARLTGAQIGALLVAGGLPNLGRIESVAIASTFPSGRVNELVIKGAGGRSVTLTKAQIRTVLGVDTVRSQMFTVSGGNTSAFAVGAPGVTSASGGVWVASASGGAERKENVADLDGKWVAQGGSVSASSSSVATGRLQGSRFIAAGGSRSASVTSSSSSASSSSSSSASSSSSSASATFVFKGQGWGHGVGMSQYGAYNRSRDGHSYKDILSFYYPETEIKSGY